MDRNPTPPLWQSGLQWAGMFGGLALVWTVLLGGVLISGRGFAPGDRNGWVVATAISGGASLVALALLAWWLVLYRRVLRARADALAGKDPTVEVLPLTPSMVGFLHSKSSTGGNWRTLAAMVMAGAVIIAAIPTVIYIINGWPIAVIAAIWFMTLSTGGIVSFILLHHVGQERRDLERGLFLRESGRFDTQFRSTRAGVCVIVSIGGWSYNPVWGDSIQHVGPGRGAVSYLPVSGDVLEIRDESGRVLWSLFARSEAQTGGTAAATS